MMGILDQAVELMTQQTRLFFKDYTPQAAAICLRGESDDREVLLINRKSGGKLGIPKGTIEVGETSVMAAAREAYEEAGVTGVVGEDVSTFIYEKSGRRLPCRVTVHLMEVSTLADDFPEQAARKRTWMGLRDAVKAVHQREVADVLRHLVQRHK